MNKSILNKRILPFALSLIVIFSSNGCNQMSEIVKDESVGMNGRFEITESGLPVNWYFYTQNTIKSGDYELIIDTSTYKDGKQSLKFLVHEYPTEPGSRSHGMFKEFDASPGESLLVSLWIKNKGTEFLIKAGGVSAFEGDVKTIINSDETIDEWKQIEFTYLMPSAFERLRIELLILSSGSFWIDDIRIERN